MSQKTSIEWCDATWNPVRGCSRVSEGCRNCYAERQAARFADGVDTPFHGFVRIANGHPQWTGKVELVEKHLEDPLHWRTPKRVFVNSMSDLFHEALPDEAIDRVFAVMCLAHNHTYQILTKRPKRMLDYMGGAMKRVAKLLEPEHGAYPDGINWPPRWIWLGVSVEDQATADERIPLLLQTPAAVRFVSYEPALGPVDFTRIDYRKQLRDTLVDFAKWSAKKDGRNIAVAAEEAAASVPEGELGDATPTLNVLTGEWFDGWDSGGDGNKLDWIIVGGESGPGARPFDVQWARNTVQRCKAAGVACFVKQLGSAPFREGAHRQNYAHQGPGTHREHDAMRLKDRKGGDWSEWEPRLRVREFPVTGHTPPSTQVGLLDSAGFSR